MNDAAPSANVRTLRVALFAMRCTSTPVGRIGRPRIRSRVWLGSSRHIAFPVLAVSLAVALFAPSAANAGFSRTFLRQITGTPTGEGGAIVPFEAAPGGGPRPGGVATDAADNLWVGDGLNKLDEFGSTGVFIKTLPINRPVEENPTSPESLAIARTGSFFFTSTPSGSSVVALDETGKLVHSWLVGESGHVAVDNSTSILDPSACVLTVCTVYVAAEGPRFSISKFDSSGKPVPFQFAAQCSEQSCGYIRGNEITGTATAVGGCLPFFNHGAPGAAAVDGEGDIYVLDNACTFGTPAIIEYRPSGEFVRTITGGETPGVGTKDPHASGGFGGRLEGIAVDRASGHVLVAVENHSVNEAAIDEFDSSGHFLTQITESSPGTVLRGTPGAPAVFEMAIDSGGQLYVADRNTHAVDVYSPVRLLPGLRLGDATNRTPTSAVLNATVNPEGQAISNCHFEYVSEEGFKQNIAAHEGREAEGFVDLKSGGEAPCEPSIPADSNYHPVRAEVRGLATGTTYRYRIVAITEGTLGGTGVSGSLVFTAPAAPRVDFTSATNISSTFVDLHAQINPLGADTTYVFQYVDAAHYNAQPENRYAAAVSVPVPAADVGSGGVTGSADVSVVQPVGGLIPGVTYHFRVLATNEIGTTAGPERSFTAVAAATPGLPDGRAYELLTPPNKGSAEDMFAPAGENPQVSIGYAPEAGDGFFLETNAAFGSLPASGENAYVFSRTAKGWTHTPLTSPSLPVQSLLEPVLNPRDFSRVAFGDEVGSPSNKASISVITLAGAPGGPYSTVNAGTAQHPQHFEPGHRTFVAGASHDVSHIIMESEEHTLAPGAETQTTGSHALYQWAGGGECKSGTSNCQLVNVNSAGTLLSPCGAELGLDWEVQGSQHNAVSADGSRVFFTSPDPHASPQHEGLGGPGCWENPAEGANLNAPQLYMRSGNVTTRISKPAESGVVDPCTLPAPQVYAECYPAAYVGASEDGSKVFFVTKSGLTRDHAGIHDLELYEYDAATGKLTRISAGQGGTEANVYIVPAISADGSEVYFEASAALAPGATAHPKPIQNTGEREPVNLYRYDTTTATTSYVATVPATEGANETSNRWFVEGVPGVSPLSDSSWYATPDGRFLLFATSAELKQGYSTVGPCFSDHRSGQGGRGHCEEVYRYDASRPYSEGQSGVPDNPLCLSCNPSGAPPVSNALFSRSGFTKNPKAGQVRAMSNTGSYAFFDTFDSLVPQDSNGTLDVYEWHEGHLSLISSGKDPAPSYFLGASPDGANVFFGTHARLVPQDTDQSGDLYDARICTPGDPCIPPPAGQTAQCEGDACQNPLPAPTDATPTSSTFSGPGNLTARSTTSPRKPKRCGAGKLRRKGRCVKKRRRRRVGQAVRHNRGGSR